MVVAGMPVAPAREEEEEGAAAGAVAAARRRTMGGSRSTRTEAGEEARREW